MRIEIKAIVLHPAGVVVRNMIKFNQQVGDNRRLLYDVSWWSHFMRMGKSYVVLLPTYFFQISWHSFSVLLLPELSDRQK